MSHGLLGTRMWRYFVRGLFEFGQHATYYKSYKVRLTVSDTVTAAGASALEGMKKTHPVANLMCGRSSPDGTSVLDIRQASVSDLQIVVGESSAGYTLSGNRATIIVEIIRSA